MSGENGKRVNMEGVMANAGMFCPDCRDLNLGKIPLNAQPNQITCQNGHRFKDTYELMQRDPEKYQVAPKITVQPNQTELKLMVPTTLKDAITAKYGIKLNATVSAVLGILMEPNSFVLDEMAVQRLNDMFGEQVKPTNLTGLVFNLRSERDDAVKKAEELTVKQPVKAGPQLVNNANLTIEPGLLDRVTDKAKYQEITPNQFVTNVLTIALDNGWI
jgi:hypothetical protein